MANEEHLTILKQGVDAWNNWRKEHSEIRPDLRGIDFSFADLSLVDLSRAILYSANFSQADLSFSDLSEASLAYANFNGALQLHFVGGKLPSSRFGVRLSS